jgi:hypothetical protein
MDPMLEEEAMRQMLALGAQNAQIDPQIAQQQAMADRLRVGAPEMRHAGRLVKAPHWLELLGNMAQNGVAMSKDKKVMGLQREKGANTDLQNQMFMAHLLRQQQAARQQPQEIAGPGMQLPQPKAPGQFGDM